ncbi:hypothetical protein BGZ51_008875 [Haplosporangium sp. Z 767]|nr:hypothetical protein BGZ51_008875 [Haplosporangium sp. Z 767]KAF9192361.1 hypothetical protein BGZ50_008624 [Haplosporangium sp. Z 11]
MAPKTPQANTKLPKAPTAGGPVPLTGIPPSTSVLQRRTLTSTPNASYFKDMSPEQQNLLAEAISLHNPGLIARNPSATTTINSTAAAGTSGLGGGQSRIGGMTAVGSFDSTNNADRTSPTSLASPSSQNKVHTPQLTRRPSASRLGFNVEIPTQLPSSPITNTTIPYSGMSPLSTSASSLPTASSSPSPTTPGGLVRPSAGSPSGTRSTLPASRLSIGPGRSSLMKQPLFQRPTGAPAVTADKNPLAAVPGPTTIAPPSLDDYQIGDRVIVESMALSGYLRFIGPTEFKSGTWAGIELDTPTGKNDGSVSGIVYFQCRPKFGIFVLAAKIAKSELLFPSSPELAKTFLPSVQPPSVQETTTEPAPAPAPAPHQQHQLPQPVSHAAQAASKITAGSRASKYLGMTASQLKQRNVTPQPASSPTATATPTKLVNHNHSAVPGSSLRASSPTIRTLSGMSGSPTAPRTIASGASNARSNSPSPVPKPNRSSSPTTRPTIGARLSQTGPKPSLSGLATKPGAHTRSASSTSSATSQSSTTGARARTSPTPRSLTTPKRLSTRSDTPDTSSTILTPSESRSNLLDQATAIQMTGSPQEHVSLQLQQLQIDLDTAVAENTQLRSEMNETKSQLETTRLLEKKDLSYDERVFLSKSLGREAMDERLSQELEELHAMKAVWDKEKAAKDQEIKVVTEKMTQAWLDAARSQKERTALIKEKEELAGKLSSLQGNGATALEYKDGTVSHERQALIESLQQSLLEAEAKTRVLETQMQELEVKSNEENKRLSMANQENQAANEAKYHELIQERDHLQARMQELETAASTAAEDLESKLQTAQEEVALAKEGLRATQNQLEEETESHRQGLSAMETKLKASEDELLELQAALAKGEKAVRGLDEKTKELEAVLGKRDQEIAALRLELQDIAGMVQSEEVDRMRKVWENEKKRLEEAIADNLSLIASQQSEIQTLELNEETLLEKVKALEASEAALNDHKVASEAEMARHQKHVEGIEDAFAQERAALENRIAETKERMEELEAIALSVEDWKESCEAMQLEMIQKAAIVEDIKLQLADAQAQQETLMQEKESIQKELEQRYAADHAAQLESSKAEVAALEEEREQLLVKVSELEAALALSASTPRVTSTAGTDSEAVLNRTELEEEIAGLKQMVHELTAENASVASDNKKLMQQHDILMEAHKHVETECLKLMDEVERLHSESLALTSIGETDGDGKDDLDVITRGTESKTPLIDQDELKTALSNATALTKDSSIAAPTEKQSGQSQSATVIRLEGLLKDKQAMLDRLTQAHTLEMRDLRQRYVELDRSKAWEVNQLNKELTELESLIESKIFHEADLEEEVQKQQKQIERLQNEVSDLKNQIARLSGGAFGSAADLPPNGLMSERPPYSSPSALSGTNGYAKTSVVGDRNKTAIDNADQALFCEICEVKGHDIISCVAVFGGSKPGAVSKPSAPIFPTDLEDDRPYCENCEEFGLHYTDECPNESLTY